MRTIRIKKYTFAPSDFAWLDATGKDPDEEGTREAESIGRNAYCLYEMGIAPQVGFLSYEEKSPKRIYALAPWIIARFHDPNLLGVFKSSEEDLYYGILILNGLIIHDALLTSEEIQQWVNDNLSHDGLRFILPEEIVLPEGHGERTKSIPVETLISAAFDETENFVPYIKLGEARRKIIRFGIILGGIIAGLFLVHRLDLAHVKIVNRAVSLTKRTIRPHETVYLPQPNMTACWKIFSVVHPRIAGWRLINISCEMPKNRVVLSWNRIYGTIDDLRRVENRGTWETRMNTAVETVSFPFASVVYYSENLPSIDVVSSRFLGFFQRINNPVDVTSAGIIDPNTLSTIGRLDWQTVFDLFPGRLSSMNVAGISLTTVEYYVNSNKWLLKGGVYYAKF